VVEGLPKKVYVKDWGRYEEIMGAAKRRYAWVEVENQKTE